jgi:predicted RNA-binding Zn-ribbon protein involved in translation (DUF1610 family)
MKYCFRCKACGHLIAGAHAGEQTVPFACPVCGGGVKWGAKGQKTFEPENWEVLADAKPERLKELNLKSEEVEKWTPIQKPTEPKTTSKHIEATAVDFPGVKEKT